MFRRHAQLPVDLMFGTNPAAQSSPNEYAATLKKSLAAAYGQVRDQMGTQLQLQFYIPDQELKVQTSMTGSPLRQT